MSERNEAIGGVGENPAAKTSLPEAQTVIIESLPILRETISMPPDIEVEEVVVIDINRNEQCDCINSYLKSHRRFKCALNKVMPKLPTPEATAEIGQTILAVPEQIHNQQELDPAARDGYVAPPAPSTSGHKI
jgi:hypothetical protein